MTDATGENLLEPAVLDRLADIQITIAAVNAVLVEGEGVAR
jgi:hypothetical protein